MQKIIFALITLFVIISADTVPKDGNLTLTRVKNLAGASFYTVPAGLNYTASVDSANSTVKMLVSLYSNQGVLANVSAGFTDYNASLQNATVTNSTGKAIYLNNILSGNFSQVNITLDSAHWNQTSSVLYAIDNAVGNYTDYSKTGASGILALGYLGNNLNNYGANVPTLTVSLSQDLTTGALFFGNDSNRTAAMNSSVKLPTSTSWQVTTIDSVSAGLRVYALQNAANSSYSLIFDLNTEDIVLPKDIYNDIILGFAATELGCDLTSIYRPACNMTGDLSGLPVLIFTVGKTDFVVPPAAYVIDADQYNATAGGNVVLAIRQSDPSNDDLHNRVTSTFKKNIVFGAQALSFYTTVFSGARNGGTGTVELFQLGEVPVRPTPEPTPTPIEPAGGSKWWIVLVILAVVLVGVGIYWFVARRNKANRLQEEINGNLLRA